MAPLSRTPTRRGAAAPTACASAGHPASAMGTGRPRATACPDLQPRGDIEVPISLKDVMAAELTPHKSRVSSHKGHEYKEADSLSGGNKEGWRMERESEPRQGKQL